MQNIDPYSYQCGVIDCFNEMVRSGVKALALSHPMDSAAERDALIPFARSCCHQYGNQLYIEDTPLLTDLFPLSLNQGKFNILFYRAGHILDQYLRLKERKANLVAERAYFGGNRSQLAWEYGRLLSYPDEAIRRLISDNPEKERQNVIEVALDYLACGIDPTKATIFIQSQIPELCELSFYYMDLVSVSRLQRNPTVKSEIQMRNFEASIPVGFFTYPISQAADITAFRATTVPVGEDQEPMLEQAREIVRRFNYIYGETLVEPEILLPDNAACLRLPGTDGKAKMSKSLGNCIYLSEEPEEIQKKIMSMYTDPGHLRVQDPGKIEGNTVFTYLDAFCLPEHFERYLPDYPNLAELKAHYQRGGLGDVKVKRFLNSIMQETLEPIRNRRKEFSKDIPAIYEMLQQGCEVARAAAAETLADVKKAMKINYFDDKELIEEQVKRFSQE